MGVLRSSGLTAKTRSLTDQPHNSCEYQIDGDDVIQQPGPEKNQYAGDERKNRVISGHECHGEPPFVFICKKKFAKGVSSLNLPNNDV